MPEPGAPKPRGFTNDGKVSSDVVNDSYGTIDPADSTGLDRTDEPESSDRTGRQRRPPAPRSDRSSSPAERSRK